MAISPVLPSRFIARLACAAGITFALFAAAPAGRAQVQVDLKVSRHRYILYEPIIATVTITNNAGRDITFEDVGTKQWFNVEVNTLDGDLIPPYDPDYHLHPLTIGAGQTVKRQIDIGPLFPIRSMVTHRLRANLYFAEADRFFYSNPASFELTDGKVLWRETVGKPGDAGALRQVSLLTHQLPERLLLYVRVRDENGDNVYTTQSLGRLIMTGHDPQELFDSDNVLHVLHEAVPGTYLYTQISIDGERLTQRAYTRLGQSHPKLVKTKDGRVEVHGGQIQVAPAIAVGPATAVPKLSARPVGLPMPPKADNPSTR